MWFNVIIAVLCYQGMYYNYHQQFGFTFSKTKFFSCFCLFLFVFVYRNEMFMHMEANHGKFYSHMCGPPRPYQCSVCRRTMETEVSKLRNNA